MMNMMLNKLQSKNNFNESKESDISKHELDKEALGKNYNKIESKQVDLI